MTVCCAIHRKFGAEYSSIFHVLVDHEQILQRKLAHKILNLPRPCLRRTDEYDFQIPVDDTYLVNPHVGLKSVGKGETYFIIEQPVCKFCVY